MALRHHFFRKKKSSVWERCLRENGNSFYEYAGTLFTLKYPEVWAGIPISRKTVYFPTERDLSALAEFVTRRHGTTNYLWVIKPHLCGKYTFASRTLHYCFVQVPDQIVWQLSLHPWMQLPVILYEPLPELSWIFWTFIPEPRWKTVPPSRHTYGSTAAMRILFPVSVPW